MDKTIRNELECGINPATWIALIAGGALVVNGIRQRSLTGYSLAALGGALGVFGVVQRTIDRRPSYARGVMVKKAVIVARPPEDCYEFWRHLENLPGFMQHIESVEIVDDRRSHWVAKPSEDTRVEWDCEITTDIKNEMIGWRSLPGSHIDTAGSVRFERVRIPGGRGTRVRITMKYNPPSGVAGAAIYNVFREPPARQIEAELERFKALMESQPVSESH